jgi:hypothetical protein
VVGKTFGSERSRLSAELRVLVRNLRAARARVDEQPTGADRAPAGSGAESLFGLRPCRIRVLVRNMRAACAHVDERPTGADRAPAGSAADSTFGLRPCRIRDTATYEVGA